MLGDKVGTFTGTTTDKVLPAQGGFPVFETSAQTSGKLAVDTKIIMNRFALFRQLNFNFRH